MRLVGVSMMAVIVAGLWPMAAQAEDQARKVCMADARKLCPAAVHAFNRKAAETCLNQQIDRTTPVCHAMILKVRAEREAANKR